MVNSAKFNLFNSVKEPQVFKTLNFDELLNLIKTGGPKKELISESRQQLLKNSNKDKYNTIKITLPCTNWSFIFDGYRNNRNIIDSTGFLPLEVDGDNTLPQHNLIFASYQTLSTTGRAFLIRVEGLTQYNYKFNYNLLAKEIGINADINSAKSTQPFILPYDSNLYLNTNAEVWIAKNEEKVHYVPQKKEEGIGTVVGYLQEKRRFSNINETLLEIDFDGEAIWDLGIKKEFASILIPRNGIKEGYRNTILYAIGCQFRALNPDCYSSDIFNIIFTINDKHCFEKLAINEIKKIVSSIMKIEVPDLRLNLNETRRFFFNPDYDLTASEKRALVMKHVNASRKNKTKKDIENAVLDWDFELYGKITQKKLTKTANKNIKTIKKYYPEFKQQILLLNKEFGCDTKKPP